ncbi:PREDICTED: phosphatidylserine decarboxylase proenzyme 2-like, partial [Nicrophorus vespilloides]|uniref:Phosphatidylserine decarboxylase proenzyme 2-like n=1 Tax=Nicrophorus vespilloides TaxID=110193 RepID=A0ABM1MJC0_NICVS
HPESGTELFGKEGEQWLSDKAKAQYQFDDWAKDSETLPYWKSWNSFFTRQFKDRATQRPIAGPESNQTVISPNDGSVFRWQDNVLETDVFWFKDMRYSISDILSSSYKEQQALIDQYDLVNMFKGGTVFQTYLNPYNFHRWWVPVNGEVLFDPIVIPGDYFNKVVIPDFAGMGEVSTISFDEAMKQGASVQKGEEMGAFNYGGSSFVMIYQKMPNKKLVFIDAEGNLIPKEPILPEGSASVGGITINIGAQI